MENNMITVNSVSGGRTSAYIAANYPADFNIFALVRTKDRNLLYPDAKLRQMVSDKLGQEFIGTLEDDTIIRTMIDLEQFIGQEITWVTGKTFDEVIDRGKGWLPNKLHRFCTTEMKIDPMFEWWRENFQDPVNMQIGFRANETTRAKRMQERLNENGYMVHKAICGKTKTGNRNKWKEYEWQVPTFPLIKNGIFADQIHEYWKGKPVEFAWQNNCVGCFHRNPIMLKHVSNKFPEKFEWFAKQERTRRNKKDTWKETGNLTYDEIKNHKSQLQLFDDDFNECDSGYCGI